MSFVNPSALVISQTDGRPMYLQIVEQIQQRIAAGDWPAGAELPSIRQLAVALRVSVITVKRAYYELEREGVIVTQQGKGSTVAAGASAVSSVSPEQDTELARNVAEVVRLGALLGWTPAELAARVREEAENWQREREPQP
jgi:GntR family transcriptional regulator